MTHDSLFGSLLETMAAESRESFYQVHNLQEAKSILAGKENSNPSTYRGMTQVYEFIIESTNKELLVTVEKIQDKMKAKNVNVSEIIEYMTRGILNNSNATPVVHLHVYLKFIANKVLQPVIVFACSHQVGQIKKVCQHYNAVSIEEIAKRANVQRKKSFSSKAEQERHLDNLIKRNDFSKSYALWFLEEEMSKFQEYKSETTAVLENDIFPMMKGATNTDNSIYYRDIDESFKNYGLKPIILFGEEKERLIRYRFLVKDVFLRDITNRVNDKNIKVQADDLLTQLEDGYEKPEINADLAKKCFDKYIKGIQGQPDKKQMQDLQILLEIYAVKASSAKLIHDDIYKRVSGRIKEIKTSGAIFNFTGSSKPDKFMEERLTQEPNILSTRYPIKGELANIYLHKDNASPTIVQLKKDVSDLKYVNSKAEQTRLLDALQVKIEIIDKLMPGNASFISLKDLYLTERVSGLSKIWNMVLGWFKKGSNKEDTKEKLWKKITSETESTIDRIDKKERNIEEQKREKARKIRTKEIVEEKKEVSHSATESKAAKKEEDEPEEESEDEKARREKKEAQVRSVSSDISRMWGEYMLNISMKNYLPPLKAEVAALLDLEPDKLSMYLKKNSTLFRENGVAYFPLRKSQKQVFVNRNLLKKSGRVLTDLFDAIDKYEFENKMRDEAGTKRMDFCNEFAASLHGKGFSERPAKKILKEYQAVLENPGGKSKELLSVASFIVSILSKM